MQGFAHDLIDYVKSWHRERDSPERQRRRASFLLSYPRDLGSRWEQAAEAVYVVSDGTGFTVRALESGKVLAFDSDLQMALRLATGKLTDLRRTSDGISISRTKRATA